MKNKNQNKVVLEFILLLRSNWFQSHKFPVAIILPFILTLLIITNTDVFAGTGKKVFLNDNALRQKYRNVKEFSWIDNKDGREVIIRFKKKSSSQSNNTNDRVGRKSRKSLKELRRDARSDQNSFVNYVKYDMTLSRKSKLKHFHKFWLSNCIAMTVTEEELKEIANHPDVEEIVDNVVLSIPPIDSNGADEISLGVLDLWNHSMIGMDKIKDMGLDGSNVRVGHLDTGIDLNNSELAGKLGAWAEFGSTGEKIDSLPHDDHEQGHGTHTASIIAGNTTGVAPGVTLISALVLNQGYGSIAQALAGMEWVVDPDGDPETDDGAQIVNMSWGATGTVDVLNEAIQNMVAANVLPVCSIGNSGQGSTLSPGNTPGAIGVGAVDSNNRIVAFSGGGEVYWDNLVVIKPNIAAPGVDIPGVGLDGVYQTMSGTSFAAPHVAGAAALLLESNPDLTLSQIKQFLCYASYDGGYPGVDTYYGHGSMDISSTLNSMTAYQYRFGARDVLIKETLSFFGFEFYQFKSYFSDGQQVLATEHVDTDLTFLDTDTIIETDTIGLSDVTGDGFADLIVEALTQNESGTYLHEFLVYPSGENANSLPTSPESWFTFINDSPDATEVIGLCDVNGDARSDLVYVERTDTGYYTQFVFKVLLAQQDRTFAASSQAWYEESDLSSNRINFFMGDLNGDGKGDIVKESKNESSNYAPVLYYVALSTGDKFSSFKNKLIKYSSYYSSDASLRYVTDVNADGYDDLILINEKSSSSASVPIYISFSSGGSYCYLSVPQSWGQIVMEENSRIIGAQDVDNDGASDLLISEVGESSMVVYNWKSNKLNRFSKITSAPWFELETNANDLPYNIETQVIGIGDLGLGNWKIY